MTTHDRAVLMTLFEHCKGHAWANSSNWGSAEELSRWYNVSVSRPLACMARITLTSPGFELPSALHLPCEVFWLVGPFSVKCIPR